MVLMGTVMMDALEQAHVNATLGLKVRPVSFASTVTMALTVQVCISIYTYLRLTLWM